SVGGPAKSKKVIVGHLVQISAWLGNRPELVGQQLQVHVLKDIFRIRYRGSARKKKAQQSFTRLGKGLKKLAIRHFLPSFPQGRYTEASQYSISLLTAVLCSNSLVRMRSLSSIPRALKACRYVENRETSCVNS